MIMQFGINMLVPIGIMSWLGVLLDRRCGTSFFMVLFFFVGAVAGFQNIWRMAKSIYDDKPQEENPSEHDKSCSGRPAEARHCMDRREKSDD